MLYLKDATTRHARKLAPHLRPIDIEELEALMPIKGTENALRYSILNSDESWVVMDDSLVVGLAGYAKLHEDHATVWLVGSKLLTARPKEFHRLAGEVLNYIHDKYAVLTNVLLEKNTLHRRWLEAQGAEFRFRYLIHTGDYAMRFYHVRTDRDRPGRQRLAGRGECRSFLAS